MSALSDRHEALFSQFFDIQSELISASELRRMLLKRWDQHEIIMEDESTPKDLRHDAHVAQREISALIADIDTIMGRR